jgi:phosphate-selective porin OprO/OprP
MHEVHKSLCVLCAPFVNFVVPLFCVAWTVAVAVVFPLAASAADSRGPSFTFDEYRPTLTSADGRFSVSLRARLQLDTGTFDQASDVAVVTPLRDVEFKHLDSGALVRRLYVGIEGRAFRDLWYEFRMDFGGEGFTIADPYVQLARVSYNVNVAENALVRFTIGQFKPIYTFADATSSASLSFLERPAAVNVATSVFGGGTGRVGAELTLQQGDVFRSGDNLVVSASLSGQIASRRQSEFPGDSTGKGTHVLGRIAYRLWSDGPSNIQVGGSLAHKLKVGEALASGAPHTVTLEDRPEIRVDGNRLVSTGPLPARGGTAWGLEASGNLANIYFASEFWEFAIERDTTCPACTPGSDPSFSGWYVEASWILTGETKTYQPNANNNGMATYANPHVAAPFALGGFGAWEIVARYSTLDLNWEAGALGTTCAPSACIRGGAQKIWSIGLNWYLSNNVRFLLDYMHVDVDKLNGSGAQVGQTFSVVGTRLQFTN